MGYVNILTSSGFGATASSQTDIAAATVLAVKVRFDGAIITGMGDYDIDTLVEIWDGSSTLKFRLSLERSTINVHAIMADDTGALLTSDYHAVSNYSGGSDYIIYCHHFYPDAPPSTYRDVIAHWTAGGSEITAYRLGPAQQSRSFDTGRGHVRVAKSLVGTVPTGKIDGVAIYDEECTGNDEWGEPQNTDSGILWYVPFDETSGSTAANDVSGATSLTMQGSEDTDFSWVAGGGWDASPSGPPTGPCRIIGS